MSASLTYSTKRVLAPEQFRGLLVRSTLGERRPINDAALLAGMLENSNLVVTCWDGVSLVGIARSVTDFHYCCYLSDLAVDAAHQKRGIGKELIRRTREGVGGSCKLILLSAPGAVSYYEHLGFTRHEQAWVLDASGG